MSQPFPAPDSVNVMLARKLADLFSMSVNEVLSRAIDSMPSRISVQDAHQCFRPPQKLRPDPSSSSGT